MGVVIHTKVSGGGGGGSGTGWNGQVEFRSGLPITLGTPAVGEIYLVEKPTTILFGAFTTYQSGLYRRDTNAGALSDWRRLNVKVKFTDGEFAIVNAGDQSKQAKFDLSLITTATTRTQQVQDKDGVIAHLDDADLQGVYDNTTTKELVVDATGLTTKDNASPISVPVYEVTDNAGTTSYFAVTNVGVGINKDTPVTRLDVQVDDGDNISAVRVVNNDTTNDTGYLVVEGTSNGPGINVKSPRGDVLGGIVFNDGNVGFYQRFINELVIQTQGMPQWVHTGGDFKTININGAGMNVLIPSASHANFRPRQLYQTGLGAQANDHLNLITNSATALHIDDSQIVDIINAYKAPATDYTNNISNPSHVEGRVFYDMNRSALSYYNDESATTVNIGQEVIFKVYNDNGATIMNGEAVRYDGSVVSGVPTIVKSLADTVANAQVAGVATHDILIGETGYITLFGAVGGLNTSSFNEGDVLFVSATTPGLLTNTEQAIQSIVGVVNIQNASTGEIIVKTRPVSDPFAIAQATLAAGTVTQAITTTPEPVSAYVNTASPDVNITANFTASEGQFECEFVPISPAFGGFYEVIFNVRCTYGDSKNVIFTLYINGSPTNVSGIIPFASLDPSEGGSVIVTGITPIATDTDELEIFVEAAESSGTLTYESVIFNVKRLGIS